MWDMPFSLQWGKNRENMQCLLALLLTHGLCQGHSLTKTNPTVKTAISGVGSCSLAGSTAGHRHGRGLMTAYRRGEFVFEKKNAISIRGKTRKTLLFFHCLPKVESLIISLVFARNFIKYTVFNFRKSSWDLEHETREQRQGSECESVCVCVPVHHGENKQEQKGII